MVLNVSGCKNPFYNIGENTVSVSTSITDGFFLYKLPIKKKKTLIFRERGREGERGRETSMCGCLSCAPNWGPGPQPRHVS